MRTAIFTIVQDESVYLRQWVAHHQTAFDQVFVLDHDSRGDSAVDLNAICRDFPRTVRIPVAHAFSFDDAWLVGTARRAHAFLLQSYAVAAFVAADEYLVAPAGVELAAAITAAATASAGVVRVQGYEVVHVADREPAMDWSSPWLAQRHWWYPCRRSTRPVFGTLPICWTSGWRDATNSAARDGLAADIALVHAHKIDAEYGLLRHRQKAARQWSPESRRSGVFRHNLIGEPEQFSRWLRADADDPRSLASLVGIPDMWRASL